MDERTGARPLLFFFLPQLRQQRSTPGTKLDNERWKKNREKTPGNSDCAKATIVSIAPSSSGLKILDAREQLHKSRTNKCGGSLLRIRGTRSWRQPRKRDFRCRVHCISERSTETSDTIRRVSLRDEIRSMCPRTLKQTEYSAHKTSIRSSISATTSAAYVSYSYSYTHTFIQA